MCTSSCLPGSQAGLQVGSSIWSLARRSSGHSLCGLPDSLWSGGHSLFGAWHGGHSLGSLPESLWSRGHSLFGAWHGGHSLWSLDRNSWSAAAEDLLGLCTAPGTYQMLMILTSDKCLCCKTGADSRIALLRMQHLLLLLMQQPVVGMLYGHTSPSCILPGLVILCTRCLDCKRLRWPWCYFNTTIDRWQTL